MKIPLQIVLNITLDLDTGKVEVGKMEPTQTVKIPASAAAVEVYKDAANHGTRDEPVSKPADPATEIKDEAMRAALVKAVNDKGKGPALEVLAKSGYAKVVDIPQADRAAFLASLAALEEIPF